MSDNNEKIICEELKKLAKQSKGVRAPEPVSDKNEKKKDEKPDDQAQIVKNELKALQQDQGVQSASLSSSSRPNIRSSASNRRQIREPKREKGLVPGGPRPGAFSVRRRARGSAVALERILQNAAAAEVQQVTQIDASVVPDRPLQVEARGIYDDPQSLTEKEKIAFYRRRIRINVLLLSFAVIVAVVIAVVVSSYRKGDLSSETNLCALIGSQPNVYMQCHCFGAIQVIANNTLHHYELLQSTLPLSRPDNVSSCNSDNLALLLLASMNSTGTAMSNSQFLDQYVLNLIYLSWDGPNWIQHGGWSFLNHSVVNSCNWTGVTCEGDRVTELDLSRNSVMGIIVSELGFLTSLTALKISSNHLVGAIPTEIGKLTQLQVFKVDDNELTGTIPTELLQLSNLLHLSIGSNSLSQRGPFPLWGLQHLTNIDASKCDITGSIPSNQLGLMTRLTALHLQGNNLTSKIPSKIGLLTNLEAVVLTSNKLYGSLPTTIANLSKLNVFAVDDNDLSGTLPSELGRLTNLELFSSDNNNITGKLPIEIGNCTSLIYFSSTSNNHAGKIPDNAMGKLTNLVTLLLQLNDFTGILSTSSTTGLCELRRNGSLEILEMDCNAVQTECICCTTCFS